MYNLEIQSKEEKRKLDKMNMLLNNLEQKLDGNEDLCRRVAKVIDMTVENSLLASRLGEIDTCIPEIEKRISALLSSCQNSCDRARNDVVSEICHMYADKLLTYDKQFFFFQQLLKKS